MTENDRAAQPDEPVRDTDAQADFVMPESPDAAAPQDTAAPEQPATKPPDTGSRHVARLLAVAAIVAAIVATRTSFLNGDASGNWQKALRTEVKRSAAALEDIRFLYQDELGVAMAVEQARFQQQAFTDAATSATGDVQADLELESKVQQGVVEAIEPSSDLATDTAYALPNGGFDLSQRLADIRAENADLVALDPDAFQQTGDRLADKAARLALAAIPISICVFFGALAQPLANRRRYLLTAGWVFLGIGVVLAIAVELFA